MCPCAQLTPAPHLAHPCQVGETYQPDRLAGHLTGALGGGGGGLPPGVAVGTSPWAWEISGQLLASLAAQAVLYGTAVLLVEAGGIRWRGPWRSFGRRRDGYAALTGSEQQAGDGAQGATEALAEAEGGWGEDEDVAAERRAVQAGGFAPASVPVLLRGISKTYWQPPSSSTHAGQPHTHELGSAPHDHGHPPDAAFGTQSHTAPGGAVRAVRNLWLRIGQQPHLQDVYDIFDGGAGPAGGPAASAAKCFGLLGVNGAGKTTVFRVLTGEK